MVNTLMKTDSQKKDFYDIINEYENKLDYLKCHTELPDDVDMNKIMDLVANVNEMVVKGD